jgi:hypothetical protein
VNRGPWSVSFAYADRFAAAWLGGEKHYESIVRQQWEIPCKGNPLIFKALRASGLDDLWGEPLGETDCLLTGCRWLEPADGQFG